VAAVSVHEPNTPVCGNAAGAVVRTFANVPGSIIAQRAMPRPTLISLLKMNCTSDIHAGQLRLSDRASAIQFQWIERRLGAVDVIDHIASRIINANHSIM
jgi:hypothetical protein